MKSYGYIKSLLLSRRFVLITILLILLSVVLSVILPQKMTSSRFEIEMWLDDHPLIAPIYKALGLDHVFTTPWFVMILAVFALILIISSIDQIKISWRRTFGETMFSTSMSLVVSANEEEIEAKLKKAGYIPTVRKGEYSKFIKHPWGNWGNALLHIGMVIVIASSLLLKVTENRGLLHLVQGEIYLPGEPWVVEDSGVFSKRFILPVSVRLERLNVEYWEDTDDVKDLSILVSITDANGVTRQHTIGINKNLDAYGLRIYLGRRYGDAFFIEITDMHGHHFKNILQIEHPQRRDMAGYNNFFIKGIPYMIKAKYYADADRNTVRTVNPLLVLRLVTEREKISDIKVRQGRLKPEIKSTENVYGELSLRKGEAGRLGQYEVRFLDYKPWSGIIFVRSKGMTGIFIGFFIIITGVSLTYFLPPRELIVLKRDSGYELRWRAIKFENFYEEEFKRLRDSLGEMT